LGHGKNGNKQVTIAKIALWIGKRSNIIRKLKKLEQLKIISDSRPFLGEGTRIDVGGCGKFHLSSQSALDG
jgi:hypothetical protein